MSTPTLSIPRPQTEAELAEFIYERLGIRIPRVAVKPGHSAPWDAFCNAYFARSPVAVWLGARALAGKSFTLALLGWTEAITLHANVSIIGGSGDQSEKVLEYLTGFWGKPTAPTNVLSSDPTQRRVDLVWGNKIRALTSSQKQARGGHPERLRLDEADEMDFKILKAVMGQPMGRDGVDSQTVISSTHHNPEGTMTQVLELAKEKGWPVYQWGYPETLAPNGWLTQYQVDRKKQEMTSEAWRIEVEMGEPSIEGRAFMEEKIEKMFVGEPITVDENDEVEFEMPREGATYATGVDWGQSGHYTEIVTFRTDVRPLQLVAYRYMRRRPYPEMVAKLDYRLVRYPGDAAHDYTGVGRVGEFLTEGTVEDVTMVGRVRDDLFREYVLAVEREELRAPRIERLYKQHKFCRTQDLFGHGENAHPPDGLVACAMANKAGGSTPVRLLFAENTGSRTNYEATAVKGRATDFLRRGIRVRDDEQPA